MIGKFACWLLMAVLACTGAAFAQDASTRRVLSAVEGSGQALPANYPNKPIRLIIAVAPGAGADAIARAAAQRSWSRDPRLTATPCSVTERRSSSWAC